MFNAIEVECFFYQTFSWGILSHYIFSWRVVSRYLLVEGFYSPFQWTVRLIKKINAREKTHFVSTWFFFFGTCTSTWLIFLWKIYIWSLRCIHQHYVIQADTISASRIHIYHNYNYYSLIIKFSKKNVLIETKI